jgi:excinuclease UvrABC ATPase subunit
MSSDAKIAVPLASWAVITRRTGASKSSLVVDMLRNGCKKHKKVVIE